MAHIRAGRRMALLRLSALGFALLSGVLAFGYFLLFGVLSRPSPALWLVVTFALPTMPGAALSWWLLVVVPKRSSASVGACAGLLTIKLAPLEVVVGWLMYGTFSTAPLTPSQVLVQALAAWLIGLLIVCATPLGWVMLLVGAAAGALYGKVIGRDLPVAPSGEATADSQSTFIWESR